MAQLEALLKTIGIESGLGFLVWLVSPYLRSRAPRLRYGFCLLGVNLVSHPLAWRIYNDVRGVDPNLLWYAIECGVTAFEAVIYRRAFGLSWSFAAGLSLLLNIGSVMIGAWLR